MTKSSDFLQFDNARSIVRRRSLRANPIPRSERIPRASAELVIAFNGQAKALVSEVKSAAFSMMMLRRAFGQEKGEKVKGKVRGKDKVPPHPPRRRVKAERHRGEGLPLASPIRLCALTGRKEHAIKAPHVTSIISQCASFGF